MESKITEEFDKKRKEQQMLLKKQISISPFYSNKKKIKVYSIEASVGKTYTLIETLNQMAKMQPRTKTLVVSKFISEGMIIQEKVENAVAINSETGISEDELEDYKVVVITHELYKRLCKDKIRRAKYTKGRRNLIIDEELSILRTDELSAKTIYEMETILNEIYVKVPDDETNKFYQDVDLQEIFKKTIEGIQKEANKHIDKQMKFFYYEDEKAERKLDLLKELVEKAKFHEEYLQYLKTKHKIKASKESVLAKLEMYKKFFNNDKVIVQSKKLFTYDDTARYFLLDNTILLDASAKFNELYKISPMFEVVDTERIVDHSKWTLHVLNENSSGWRKRHDDEYYGHVKELIIDNAKDKDRILLLALQYDINILQDRYGKEFDEMDEKEIEVQMVNFHAMRGKNEWADFNKCFIIHTPVMAYAYYAFMYMLYTDEMLKDEELYTQKIHKNWGFKSNQTLERLRKTDIISNLYQGIKRINRHNENLTDVYILNSDESIIEILTQQFKNVNVDRSLKFAKKEMFNKEVNYDNSNRKQKAEEQLKEDVNIIVKFLETLVPGQYKKRIIRDYSEIPKKRMLKAIEYMETRGILANINIIWSHKGYSFIRE